MGIHYDYKSTRGAKAMEKQAKREKKLAEKRPKRQAKQEPDKDEDNKSIPLDQFINILLYDKKFGYYMKKNPFGKEGDFITAPLISNLFGEMIAIWCVAFWEYIGKPRKILLVELGPGDGSLCKDLLKTFRQFKNFYNSFNKTHISKSLE